MQIICRKGTTVWPRKRKLVYNDTIVIFKKGGNLHIALEAVLKLLPDFELTWSLHFSVQLADLLTGKLSSQQELFCGYLMLMIKLYSCS